MARTNAGAEAILPNKPEAHHESHLGCDKEFMSYPAAKGNTGVPPVLASGHFDRCKFLAGGDVSDPA